MAEKKMQHSKSPDDYKPSVMSPSDSREGLVKNCDGMPPTMSVDEIWKSNMPPNYPAKNSVETRGSDGADD